MRTPEALEEVAFHLARRGPSFGRAEHNHRPARPVDTPFLRAASRCVGFPARSVPSLPPLPGACCRYPNPPQNRESSHTRAADGLNFVVRDSCQKRWIVDLVSVQMKNGQNRSIARRIQILIDVPRRCQRSRFGFSIAYHGRNDQFGVIESCTAGVRENVAEFAAFVNGSRSLRRAVTADCPRERELPEELVQSLRIQTLFWINF
jgi:hypothetical protein